MLDSQGSEAGSLLEHLGSGGAGTNENQRLFFSASVLDISLKTSQSFSLALSLMAWRSSSMTLTSP